MSRPILPFALFLVILACWGGLLSASEGEGFVPFHEPQDGTVAAATNVPSLEGSEREHPVVRGTSAGRVVTGGFVAASDNSGDLGDSGDLESRQIRQVQATLPSGSRSAGNAMSSPSASGGSVEETINSMIGAKYASIKKPVDFPRDSEQILREYDITPYTKQRGFDPATQPEQTIIDWIIRQTGLKTWHGTPIGFINATPEKLIVYHTLDVHRIVADIVDRFVNPNALSEAYTVRLVSVGKPDWMTNGHAYLRPIPIGTAGVQGWLVDKENYAKLLQDLARRSDYAELCPPQLQIPNGWQHLVTRKQQRSYLRDVQASNIAPGYVSDTRSIEEGFHFSFAPLACLDGVYSDVMLKIDIQQIERMFPVTVLIPTQDNPRARHTLETPQVSTMRVDELIRWPKDRVLLIDLGTRPLPDGSGAESKGIATGITKTFSPGPSRANFLMFIEKAASPVLPQPGQQTVPPGQPTDPLIKHESL